LLCFEKNTLAPVIEYGETVLIRLDAEATSKPGTCRLAVSMAWSCHAARPKRCGSRFHSWRPAKISRIRLARARGPSSPRLIEVSGTPRSAKEILESAAGVFERRDPRTGLSHASPVLVDRLVTLAVLRRKQQICRVSLWRSRPWQDEVDSMLKREARADESRLLLVDGARVRADGSASSGRRYSQAGAGGVTRAGYVDVPEIELFGKWEPTPGRPAPGYEGLTVLFWSNQFEGVLVWAAAQAGHGKGSIRGDVSMAKVPGTARRARSRPRPRILRLRNARRTANGRLSGSAKTSALVLAPTPIGTLDFAGRLFGSWRALEAYVRQKQPLGLCDPNPLGADRCFGAGFFGARRYDVISQPLRGTFATRRMKCS
jgi:hypothetical protein